MNGYYKASAATVLRRSTPFERTSRLTFAAPLARIGLHGVLTYRLALGAARGQVIQLVLKEAVFLILAGLAIGLAGSLALGQAAASLLYGIAPRDPIHLTAAATTLAAAAAIGSLIPARQASRLDPMNALRDE